MRDSSMCSHLTGGVTICVFRAKPEVLVPADRNKGGEQVWEHWTGTLKTASFFVCDLLWVWQSFNLSALVFPFLFQFFDRRVLGTRAAYLYMFVSSFFFFFTIMLVWSWVEFYSLEILVMTNNDKNYSVQTSSYCKTCSYRLVTTYVQTWNFPWCLNISWNILIHTYTSPSPPLQTAHLNFSLQRLHI